jgi:hypothetical protein
MDNEFDGLWLSGYNEYKATSPVMKTLPRMAKERK